MIKVIIGKKGTGKTRRLMDMANTSAGQDKGDVVFVDNNNKYMYDLNYKVRFINTSEFSINDSFLLQGFICGIIAANFDITEIYIDEIFEIAEEELKSLEAFFKRIDKVSKKFNVSFVVAITGDPENVPEFIKQYI